MTSPFDRRVALRLGLALGAGAMFKPAAACEIAAGTFTIVHPWARATADDAVAAAVCMSFHEVVESDRLVGAESPVCERAEMGGAEAGPLVDFFIPEGQTTVLSEAGTYLRLVGLKFPLPVGRQYPLTLMFKKAGPVRASLHIDYVRFG